MEQKFLNLKKWIVDNGGFIHDSLNLGLVNNLRGIVCTKKIPQGTKLYEIPCSCSINVNDSEAKYESFQNINNYLIKKILLIKKLHEEFNKKEDSFYYHYLSLLPSLKDLCDLPLYKAYYNNNISKDVEIYKIYNERTTILILEELNSIAQCMTYFKSLESYSIVCEDILYYYLLINTRSWDEFGMIPFIDLCQHKPINYTEFNVGESSVSKPNINESTIEKGDTQKKSFHCVSNLKLKENKFLYINYGIFDEEKLYTNYGFVSDSKNVNFPRYINIFFNLQLDQKNNLDQFIFNQISLLNNNSNVLQNKLYFSNEGKLNDALLYYLRIINLSVSDMKNIDWLQNIYYYATRISLENELKCYKMLLELIKSKLEKFKKLENIKSETNDDFLETLKKLSVIEKNVLINCKTLIIKLWNSLLID